MNSFATFKQVIKPSVNTHVPTCTRPALCPSVCPSSHVSWLMWLSSSQMPAMITAVVNFRYQLHGMKDSPHSGKALLPCSVGGGRGLTKSPTGSSLKSPGLTKESCGAIQSLRSCVKQKAHLPPVCPRAETLFFSCHWTAELRLFGLGFQDLYRVLQSSAMS